ncbi:MAG: VWA domain-containing protein [Rhodospirillales bacterium]|nr:VWA domain-containing protein [Rhodospirillales bacterium]
MKLLKQAVALSFLGILLGGFPALAQETCYSRGEHAKGEVCFPLGDASFADQVVSQDFGSQEPSANTRDPGKTLGPPDYPIQESTGIVRFLSLGCKGWLTLRFTDNALVNGEGPDLHVFEVGQGMEPTFVSISKDGVEWIDLGKISGGTADVDIEAFVKPGERFHYVRLTDTGNCGGNWPGADIDAVGAIGAVKLGREGSIRVVGRDETAGASQVELILDASGSMRAATGEGESRMAAAKRVLASVIDELPAETRVGLRVYGHRIHRDRKEESCRDSELTAPFAPLDRTAMKSAIASVKPQGQTPIGRSLTALAEDFKGAEGFKLVVLVSDGIETCNPDSGDPLYPPTVIKRLRDQGLDLRVNVVGFEIGESETRAFLKKVAEASGGRYFSASSTAELKQSLGDALSARFSIRDGNGERLAEGSVGDAALSVPSGAFEITVETEPRTIVQNVPVEPDMETLLTLTRGGAGIEASWSIVERTGQDSSSTSR